MSEETQAQDASAVSSAVSNTKQLTNYVTGDHAPSMMEQLKIMSLGAKVDGSLLMVNGIRYSFVGIPSIITDEYVYFSPGSIEMGETGKLGTTEKQKWEKNPYPVLVSAQSICGAEWIKVDENRQTDDD